jgi:hypothetical protein
MSFMSRELKDYKVEVIHDYGKDESITTPIFMIYGDNTTFPRVEMVSKEEMKSIIEQYKTTGMITIPSSNPKTIKVENLAFADGRVFLHKTYGGMSVDNNEENVKTVFTEEEWEKKKEELHNDFQEQLRIESDL